jgi:hypothetical protein
VNHLRPAASDAPTAFAAAGFCHPAPINLQNSRLSSRRTGGEPSDPSFGRTGLRDFISRHLSISQVLRRLLESGVGWDITMIDGMPWFIPPPWIDPDQKPRQHSRHKLRELRT